MEAELTYVALLEDRSYGMFINKESLIVYFEYDMSESNITRRVGSAYEKEFDYYDAYRDVNDTN